jgi:hypothetical protein
LMEMMQVTLARTGFVLAVTNTKRKLTNE